MNTHRPIFALIKATRTWVKQDIGCKEVKGILTLNKSIGLAGNVNFKHSYSKSIPPSLQYSVQNGTGKLFPERLQNAIAVQANTNTVPSVNMLGDTCNSWTVFYDRNSDNSDSIPSWYNSKEEFNTQKMDYVDIFNNGSSQMFHTLNRIGTNASMHRFESTKASSNDNPTGLSRKDKLKRAVAEYGSTVVIFHVGISLVSLGACYLFVTSGIDMGKFLMPLGINNTVVSNTGTFVTAYAIHKVFAPVRISITLASTPFIVRYLRNIGFLKPPKSKT